MQRKIGFVLACLASILPLATADASGGQLPGDRVPGRGPGGPGGAGGPGGPGGAAPGAPRPRDPAARAPSIDLAVKAAQAIAAACKQYPMALAVTDSEGVAKLIYVPDGSAAWHGYSAVRKAYTAITFKADTSKVIKQVADDPAMQEKFKSDANLTRQSGGLVLMVGDQVIGAIGVSGAEPGGHDEECGLVGRERIKNELK